MFAAPALNRAVHPDAAGVIFAGADGAELARRGAGLAAAGKPQLALFVPAPAGDGMVGPDGASMVAAGADR